MHLPYQDRAAARADRTAEELCEAAIALSGPFSSLDRSCEGRLYGSYHWPRFTFTNAQRNTLQRMKEFHCPELLARRTVLDLGCNLGSLALEAMRRQALGGLGVEYRCDRVDLANQIARFLGLADRLRFVAADLNGALETPEGRARMCADVGQHDVVFCCSLDAYVDPLRLYEFLAAVTRETCFFESNHPITEQIDFTQHMQALGFATVGNLGSSRTDAWERRLFYLDKRPLVSWRHAPDSPWNHRTYRVGQDAVTEYESARQWEKIARLCRRIAHIPQVAPMDFSVPGQVRSPWFSRRLGDLQLTAEDRARYKGEVVALVRGLNEAGVAHRDIHPHNVYIHEGRLYLGDWEYIEENRVPLKHCYDLTGQGLPSPLRSNHMNVFHPHPFSLWRILEIRPEDFDG